MQVLIIGGTGLISTPITRFLVARGDEVTHYNRGQTQADVPQGVKHISGDRTNHSAFEAQMLEAGAFDCVIDMAGYETEDAKSAVRAFHGRIGQFIFCSTVDVYTKPASRYPILESESRQPDESFLYAYKKSVMEITLQEAHARGDFPVTIIRPAYTYGEGRGPIHTFGGKTSYLDRVRKDKPIVVHGDGNSFWTACYRDDVAHAFVQAAGNPATYGQAYHVTGEEWLTWNRYHAGVAETLGVPLPPLMHIPTDLLAKLAPKNAYLTNVNFQFSNIFDNTAAKRDLDFRYTLSWIDGVHKMIAWLDEHNTIENSDNDPFEDRLIAAWQSLELGVMEAS